MPWSPIPHIKQALRNIIAEGYEKEVTLALIKKELTKTTGCTRDSTITRYLKLAEDFNMITRSKDKTGRIWQINSEDEWEL